jgi:serine O-acetyltransferase
MPDPVANAINTVLDHLHVIDRRMEEMSRGLQKLGGDVSDLHLPELPTYSEDLGDSTPVEPTEEQGDSPSPQNPAEPRE